ncbi:MAG: FAD-dependent oxidoreductase, partial [Rubrobacter sp.]|nr:FAD-dependent oxidoreductase [Rubrobacter sp.]
SPVGGVGSNLAIQDAVVAANVLTGPLREGKVSTPHLAAVQRRREWAVRLVQAAQDVAQRRVVAKVLEGNKPFELPCLLWLLLRVPFLRDVPAHLIAYGAGMVRLKEPKGVI